MAHLEKLKISKRIFPDARPRRTMETPDYRRSKLITNLEEQLELAILAINKQPLELKRKRGHNVVTVRPRLWWRKTTNGEVITSIRYNKVALNLDLRGTTIEVGSLRNLPAVYRTVLRAVKAGELDRAIENAARKPRTN